MNLLETMLSGQGRGALMQVARELGIEEAQAKDAAGKLVPALTRGLQRNTSEPGGLDQLKEALQRGNHQRYLDDPEQLTSREGVADGNSILGHLFGNKDVSRQVAARTADSTGLDVGSIKKMLPMLAGLAMGALNKGSAGGRPQDQGLLAGMLDADGDGSIADDLLGMAGKFFR